MKKILRYITYALFLLCVFIAPTTLSIEDDYLHMSTAQVEAQVLAPVVEDESVTDALIKSVAVSPEEEPAAGASLGPSETVEKIGDLQCKEFQFPCHAVNILQLIVVQVGNVLVAIAGLFLDYFLQHSIASASYRGANFIKQGWEILRDFTNIVFIFALLTIAFKMVLGQSDSGNKKKLITTVVIALTINFSLFASFLIIDAGNLLGHIFYNKIEAPMVTLDGAPFGTEESELLDIEPTKSISLAIAATFNPQTLLNNSGASNTDDNNNKGRRMVTVFIIGVVNVAIIYTFVSLALLFLGRTVGLYISAILSALAFASLTIPQMEDLPYVGFHKWLKELVSLSFMAPVFLFFLYVSVQFMNITLTPIPNTSSGSFIGPILSVLVPMAGILTIILLSKRVATKMAGELGTQVAGYAGKMIGGSVALGSLAATGGASAALGIVGGTSSLVGKTRLGKSLGADKFGKTLRTASSIVGSTKLDISKLPGFKMAMGEDTQKFVQKISGRSVLGHKTNMATQYQKQKGEILDVETDKIGKEKIQLERDRAKRSADKNKTVADWQKEVEDEKNKGLADALAEEMKKVLDRNAAIIPEQKKEKEYHRDMLENPDKVREEEKDLDKLNKELEDLTASINAARGSNNGGLIPGIEEEVRKQKHVIEARKQGRKVTRADVGHTAGPPNDDWTLNTYASIGSTATNFKAKHEHQRRVVQKKEMVEIKNKILRLRGAGKNKEADLLAKKIQDILTDSTKEKKYNKKDEDK